MISFQGREVARANMRTRCGAGLGIEAPERGALCWVELGEVDNAVGLIGGAAVEISAAAEVVRKALEPGAVLAEADLMVADYRLAHGGALRQGGINSRSASVSGLSRMQR